MKLIPNSVFLIDPSKIKFYSKNMVREGKERTRAGEKGFKVNPEISAYSCRKIREYIQNWGKVLHYSYRMGKIKKRPSLFFLTFTLPEVRPASEDKKIKRFVLNGLLSDLRAMYSDKLNYLWRAEIIPETSKKPQLKGRKNKTAGAIHFHILIDRNIRQIELLQLWRKHLKNYGIDVSGIVDSNLGVNKKELKRITHVTNYISKYCAKSDSTIRYLEGQHWGCSYSLSRLESYLRLPGIQQLLEELEALGEKYVFVYQDEEKLFGCIRTTKFGRQKFRSLIEAYYGDIWENYKYFMVSQFKKCLNDNFYAKRVVKPLTRDYSLISERYYNQTEEVRLRCKAQNYQIKSTFKSGFLTKLEQ